MQYIFANAIRPPRQFSCYNLHCQAESGRLRRSLQRAEELLQFKILWVVFWKRRRLLWNAKQGIILKAPAFAVFNFTFYPADLYMVLFKNAMVAVCAVWVNVVSEKSVKLHGV